jgi:hypothetical protein
MSREGDWEFLTTVGVKINNLWDVPLCVLVETHDCQCED